MRVCSTKYRHEPKTCLSATAANCHCRCAQGHQPLDLRSATGAQYVDRVAARLCEAYDLGIFLRQGELLCQRAHHGPIPHLADLPIGRGFVNGRAFVDRAPVHVHDLQISAHEFPDGSKAALRLGHRTVLAVPLLREDEAIGTLQIRRTEVKPFTDKQIELVKTFADQAVIAIENVRLFDEVQARTRELSESLEQQTATSEVLQVISSSPGELEPVFNAMLANAIRICEAKFGVLFLAEGDAFRAVALHGVPAAYAEARSKEPVIRPGRELVCMAPQARGNQFRSPTFEKSQPIPRIRSGSPFLTSRVPARCWLCPCSRRTSWWA